LFAFTYVLRFIVMCALHILLIKANYLLTYLNRKFDSKNKVMHIEMEDLWFSK